MVNNVTLVGRITKDPEIKNLGGSGSVCNFTVAASRTFKNQNGEYDADFINCVAFNALADRMNQYVGKGNLLAIIGRIQTRNYENNMGQRVYVTEVVANNISFLESRNRNDNNQSGFDSPYVDNANNNNSFNADQLSDVPDISDDDLPF